MVGEKEVLGDRQQRWIDNNGAQRLEDHQEATRQNWPAEQEPGKVLRKSTEMISGLKNLRISRALTFCFSPFAFCFSTVTFCFSTLARQFNNSFCLQNAQEIVHIRPRSIFLLIEI